MSYRYLSDKFILTLVFFINCYLPFAANGQDTPTIKDFTSNQSPAKFKISDINANSVLTLIYNTVFKDKESIYFAPKNEIVSVECRHENVVNTQISDNFEPNQLWEIDLDTFAHRFYSYDPGPNGSTIQNKEPFSVGHGPFFIKKSENFNPQNPQYDWSTAYEWRNRYNGKNDPAFGGFTYFDKSEIGSGQFLSFHNETKTIESTITKLDAFKRRCKLTPNILAKIYKKTEKMVSNCSKIPPYYFGKTATCNIASTVNANGLLTCKDAGNPATGIPSFTIRNCVKVKHKGAHLKDFYLISRQNLNGEEYAKGLAKFIPDVEFTSKSQTEPGFLHYDWFRRDNRGALLFGGTDQTQQFGYSKIRASRKTSVQIVLIENRSCFNHVYSSWASLKSSDITQYHPMTLDKQPKLKKGLRFENDESFKFNNESNSWYKVECVSSQ